MIPCGVTLPGGFEDVESVDVAMGTWSVEARLLMLCKSWLGIEVALAAKITDAEALKPRNSAEAKHCPNWPLWEQAISEELTTLCKASTWKLEAPLPRANIISMKWVFKAKKDASRKVVWYKAWLVAQGFSQVEGVNYFDTYTPVAKLTSS